MFRKIDIDFGDVDDDELKELKCEGVESMLIDWQMGFLGSVCNDLMWCMYPFFEVNNHDKDLYEFAFRHYYDELKNVLDTFNSDLKTFGLPEQFAEFRSVLRRGFVLEFLIVTVLRPVMNITKPQEMMTWYEKILKYDKMKENGGIQALLAGKKPKMPAQEDVFDNPRYMEFLQFYFKIATAMGAFQELGLVYFELMKDGLFKDTTTPMVKKKTKMFSKDWFKKLLTFSCFTPEKTELEDFLDKEEDDEAEAKAGEYNIELQVAAVEETVEEIEEQRVEEEEEGLFEQIEVELKEIHEPKEPEESVAVVEEQPEKSPTPDPLRMIGAQLLGQLQGYKSDFDKFSNLMEDHRPEPLEEETTNKVEVETKVTVERKLSTDAEIAMVRKMSSEDAWSHVVSQVFKVCCPVYTH